MRQFLPSFTLKRSKKMKKTETFKTVSKVETFSTSVCGRVKTDAIQFRSRRKRIAVDTRKRYENTCVDKAP